MRLSDPEVIEMIVNGETSCFAILIRKYNPYLYKIGRSYGFNHQDVEDLMQDTFINVFNNLTRLENFAYFKTWITRIMLNECYRKTNKLTTKREVIINSFLNEKTVPMFSGNNINDTAKKVGNRELNAALEKAIVKLPVDYRLVFSLRELNGLTVQETATLLKITESNVKVRLNRAKAMLRKELEKMYSPEDIFEFNLIYCDAIVKKVMSHIHSTK